LNLDQSEIGLDQAANTEERAKYQALADLVSDPTRTQISKDDKNIKPVGFNSDQFNKDVAARKSSYDEAYRTQKIPGLPETMGMSGSPSTAENVEKGIQYYRELANQGDQNQAFYIRNADLMQQKLDDWKSQFKLDRKIKKG